MSTPTIDYDKLAQQHGGTSAVDYDALAAQHGGSSAAAQPAAAPTAPSYWETLTNPVGSGAHEQGALGGIEQVGGQAIKTMAQPILHPLDTATGALKTATGALKAGAYLMGHGMGVQMPEEWNPGKPIVEKYLQDKDAGGHALAIENLLGQGIGTVEGGRAMSPVIAKAASVLPTAAGRVALIGKTPEAAYESALKPSTTLSPAERTAAIQTGLKESIPVSKGGLEKIGSLIDDLNQKIATEIRNDPNRPIDPNAVATRADAAKAKFANQVNAQPDLNAIEASRQQFLNEQGAQPGTPGTAPRPTGLLDAQGNPIMSQGTPATPPQPAPPMGATDAQAMKQGTYRVLRGKFGEQGSASVEAQKSLARGLKEEIATQFPEISKLNATESQLLDLQPLLERAVNRISNRDAVGIGSPIAGTAAAAMTKSTLAGGAVTVLKSVLDNPAIKSRLAIAVSKGAKIPYADALSKVAAYSGSLGATSLASPGSSNGDTPSQSASNQP